MDVRDFPPLYTLQPVPRTRARQLELWRGLLVSSASAGGSGSSTSIDLSTWPGFSNESLSRSLEWEGRRAVGDAVVEAGWGEWEDAPAKTRLRVFSKPPEAWGALIYAWASDTARVGGAICTLFVSVGGLRERTRTRFETDAPGGTGTRSTRETTPPRRSSLGCSRSSASRRSRRWRRPERCSCSPRSRWTRRA